MEEHIFDHVVTSPFNYQEPPFNTIAELIYKTSPYRSEDDSTILLTHHLNGTISISLDHYRFLTTCLLHDLERLDIKKNDTVLLATLSSNSILYTALIFTALIARGNRVFMPMFVETGELDTWLNLTKCNAVILPRKEIASTKNKREQKVIDEILTITGEHAIPIYDTLDDFTFHSHIMTPVDHETDHLLDDLVQQAINDTTSTTEAAIFTTSGTTGISKLIVYNQSGFLNNCASWQASGAYGPDKAGGRTFIDILPHTISIRAYFNAIWTGRPLCFIKSDSIKNTPESILSHLREIRPEVLTLGPGSFKVICEFIDTIPEIRDLVFSDLHTIISTGAPYSTTIARHCSETFGLSLHNAYGTTETQQIQSTILNDTPYDPKNMPLGISFPGVKIGLEPFQDDIYRLYIKTPFGHALTIDHETGEKLRSPEYYNTGDLIRFCKGDLYYHGREKQDYIKNGYGAKIPLILMKERYKDLYGQIKHIDYYPYETNTFSLGLAALIFIDRPDLPKGAVLDHNTIQHYQKLIIKINKQLIELLEPFEYEQQTILRFLLINDLPTTAKGTISHYKIAIRYAEELTNLKHDSTRRHGVTTTMAFNMKLVTLLLHLPLLRIKMLRHLLLKILLHTPKHMYGEKQ